MGLAQRLRDAQRRREEEEEEVSAQKRKSSVQKDVPQQGFIKANEESIRASENARNIMRGVIGRTEEPPPPPQYNVTDSWTGSSRWEEPVVRAPQYNVTDSWTSQSQPRNQTQDYWNERFANDPQVVANRPQYNVTDSWTGSSSRDDDEERSITRPRYDPLSSARNSIDPRAPQYNVTDAWTSQSGQSQDYWNQRFANDPQVVRDQTRDLYTRSPIGGSMGNLSQGAQPRNTFIPTFGTQQEPRPGMAPERSNWQPRSWMQPGGGINKQQIIDSQPGPIENRVGDLIGGAGNAISNWYNNTFVPQATELGQTPLSENPITQWWENTPEYMFHQDRMAKRGVYEPPSDTEIHTETLPAAKTFEELGMDRIGAIQAAGMMTLANQASAVINRPAFLRNVIRGLANGLGAYGEVQAAVVNQPLPGIGASLGDVVSPVGRTLNQQLNPFVSDFTGTEPPNNIWEAGALAAEFLRNPLTSQLGWAAATAAAKNVSASRKVRGAVAAAAEANPNAKMALRNMSSLSTMEVLDIIQNKDKYVRALLEQATELTQIDPVKAGELFLQAHELRNMSYGDIVESKLNVWSELGYGFLDPIDFVAGPVIGLLGILPEARAVAKAGKLYKVPPTTAITNLADAVSRGAKLDEALVGGSGAAKPVFQQIMTPFIGPAEQFDKSAWMRVIFQSPTPAAEATKSAKILRNGFAGIFYGVSSKEDAHKLIDITLNRPEELVKGVVGLSRQTLLNQGFNPAGGIAKYGSGAVGGGDFPRFLPIAKTVETELHAMDSLKGPGPLNLKAFDAELSEVLWEGARRVTPGGKKPRKLPYGASKVEVESTGLDKGRVIYKDSKGNVLRAGPESSLMDANRRLDIINNEINPPLKLHKVPFNVLKGMSTLMRWAMNDTWLYMRGANIFGNATGGNMQMFAHNVWTSTPVKDIQDWNSKIFGGFMGTTRLAKTVPGGAGIGTTARDEFGGSIIGNTAAVITRAARGWSKNQPQNPVTAFTDTMERIPYGKTEGPLLGGGTFAIGEEAMAAKAGFIPARREYESGLEWEIKGRTPQSLQNELLAAGLPPEYVGPFVDQLLSVGKTEGKGPMGQKARILLGKPDVRPTLEKLGLGKEVLMPNEIVEIERILDTATDPGAAMQAIAPILNKARNREAGRIPIGPKNPGITTWTDNDINKETAWVADSLVLDAKRAGVDPQLAKQEADRLAKQMIGGQEQTLNRLIQDVANTPNNPDTWAVVTDFWWDAQRAQEKARAAVDAAGRDASQLNTKQAWAEKWELTKQIYTDLEQHIAKLGGESRLALQDVMNGSPYTSHNDYFGTIDRLLKWDLAEHQSLRSEALGRAAFSDPATWQQHIDDERAYLDNAMYLLVGAFQRYPSLENFDIVRESFRKVQTNGAQVRAYLDNLKAQGITGEAYDAERNKAWIAFWDAGVAYNEFLADTIIYNGVLKEAGKSITWTENGIDFTLSRPGDAPGTWWVKRGDTGKEIESSSVPQKVIDDFNSVFGDEKIIDDAIDGVVQEIADSAPPTLRPQQVPAGADETTVDDLLGGTATTDWNPDFRKPVREILETTGYTESDFAQWRALGGTEGRQKVFEALGEQDIREHNVTLPQRATRPQPVPAATPPAPTGVFRELDPATRTVPPERGPVPQEDWEVPVRPPRLPFKKVEPTPPPGTDNPFYDSMRPRGETPQEPSVYSVGDAAKVDIRDAELVRADMRNAWDREAVAGFGVKKLDTYIMKYNRKGLVNLNLQKGEVKTFEDMYGTTVGGQRIDNLDDVRKFFQNYVDLGEKVKAGKATIADARQFKNKSAPEIVEMTRNELRQAGLSDVEIAELATQPRRTILDTIESIRGTRPDEPNMVAYDFAVPAMKEFELVKPSVYNLLGVESPDKLTKKNWRGWVNGSRKTGNDMPLQQADVAETMIHSVNDLENTLLRELPNILRGTPNTLSGAQRLRAQEIVDNFLPRVDDVIARARFVSEKMADWIMLNTDSKRDFDTIMGLLTSYSYFWSRMPSRLVTAALSKPSLVNFFYRANHAIAMENEKSGVPARLEGTVPVPWNPNARVQVQRPLNIYGMSGAMQYVNPNPYVAELGEDATEAQKMMQKLQQYTPGLFEWWNIAIDMLDGKLDSDLSNKLTNTFPVPLIGVPGTTIYQSVTGNMPAGGNPRNFGFGPDTFDPYRARRATTWIAEEEGLDFGDVAYANQVIMNQYNGRKPTDGLPPDRVDAALALAKRAVQRAAQDLMVEKGSSYITPFKVSPWTPAERELKRAGQRYNITGYDPVNDPEGAGLKYPDDYPGWDYQYDPLTGEVRNPKPEGYPNPGDYVKGRDLQNRLMEEDPTVQLNWIKNDEVPAVSGRLDGLYDERTKLEEQIKQAEQEAIAGMDLGSASAAQMRDAKEAARAPFEEQLGIVRDAIKKLQEEKDKANAIVLPSGTGPQGITDAFAWGNQRRTGSANPQEVTDSLLFGAFIRATQIPRPEDGAPDEEWDAYYQAQMDSIVRNLDTATSTSDIMRDKRGPVDLNLAQIEEEFWKFRNADNPSLENMRLEQLDRYYAQYTSPTEQAAAAALERIKGGDKLLEKYLAAEKGDERSALREKDWRYGAALLAGYDPDVYDAMVEQFGQDEILNYFQAYGKKPQYPGQDASEEDLQAYYDASDEFHARYGSYNEVDLWLDGRYSWQQANSSSDVGMIPYNAGKDYERAIELFGPDIFNIERAENDASVAGKWKEWKKANPEDYKLLERYNDWKKAGQNEPNETAELPSVRWGTPEQPFSSVPFPAGKGGVDRVTAALQGTVDRPYNVLTDAWTGQKPDQRMGVIGRTAVEPGVNPPLKEADGVPTDVVDKWKKAWKEYESLDDDGKKKYFRKNKGFSDYYRSYHRRRSGGGRRYSSGGRRYSSGGRSNYRPSYRSYGRGGGYGGGSPWLGGGGGGGPALPPAQVFGQEMEASLWTGPRQDRWQPPYVGATPNWLQAGQELAPGDPRRWEAPRF